MAPGSALSKDVKYLMNNPWESAAAHFLKQRDSPSAFQGFQIRLSFQIWQMG
jgi:hypothetical protein